MKSRRNLQFGLSTPLAVMTVLLMVASAGRLVASYAQINAISISLTRSLMSISDDPVVVCPDGRGQYTQWAVPDSLSSIPSLMIGMRYWYEGNCKAAAKEWLELSQSQWHNETAWVWLGVGEANLGRFDSAAKAFQLARAEGYLVSLAKKAVDLHDIRGQRLWLTVAAKTGTAFPYVEAVARQYYAVGRKSDAISVLQQFAGASTAKTQENLQALGLLERLRGNAANAVRFFDEALSLQPNDLVLLYEIRTALIDLGDYKGALRVALREADLSPDQVQARLTVASLYRLMKDYKNAELWGRRAQGANPNSWLVYNELGTISCEEGESTDALHEFNKALELAPRQLNVLIARSECLHTLGETEQAIGFAKQAIEEFGDDPRLLGLYLDLGQWYDAIGDRTSERQLYERGLKIWPQAHWLERRLSGLGSK